MKPLNLAVVGAGYWGTKLITEYLALSRDESKGCHLVKVADSSRSQLDQIARAGILPEKALSTDFRKVINDSDVDAVHIATPSETHFLVGSEALASGKHILIEKPMAMTSRDAFKLARLAEEKGRVLEVGHIFRFNNSVIKARDLLVAGKIGRTLYLRLSWSALVRPVPERDIVFDLAPHPVDVLNTLLGEWPTKVSCYAKSFLRRRVGREEVAFVTLEFPDEIMAEIHLSWLEPGAKARNVMAVGEGGVLDVDALHQTVRFYGPDDHLEQVPVQVNNTIAEMLAHFVSTIRGNATPSNSALVGAVNVKVLEGIRDSQKRGASVAVMPA